MTKKKLGNQSKVIISMIEEEQSLLHDTKKYTSKLPALYEGKPSSRNDLLLEIKHMGTYLENLLSNLNSELTTQQLAKAYMDLIKTKVSHKMLRGGIGVDEQFR